MADFMVGGLIRRLQVPRLCRLESLKQAVREAFGMGARLDIAFRFGAAEAGPSYPGGGLLPLASQVRVRFYVPSIKVGPTVCSKC
jgi:hypothetical protein